MLYRVPRRALLALLAVLALPAAMPAAASATITPRLALTPSTVSAGVTQPINFSMTFSPSGGDYPLGVALSLPPGLLLNLDGGTCLVSATPAAGCELGSGTQTSTVPSTQVVSLWLVKGPSAADAAGAALVLGTTPGPPEATADIKMHPTGEGVSFAILPAGLRALRLTFNAVRPPTSCPATPVTVGVGARSRLVAKGQNATAPLTVTGCSSLSYAPKVAATVDQAGAGGAATFTTTVTLPANDSATQALALDIPATLKRNGKVAVGCLKGKACTVGSAVASSYFLPSSALSNGTVKVGGTTAAPTVTVTFPAPYPISLKGTISLPPSPVALTFTSIPDLPLTSLALEIGGSAPTDLFTTACAASNLTAKLTPWDGAAQQSISKSITLGGTCPPPGSQKKPTASGASLAGLVKDKPKLVFTANEGKGAKRIKTIAVSLPKGLTFSSKKKSLKKGIIVGNTHGKNLKFTGGVKRGVLTITLSATAPKAKITLESPAISDSKKLAKSVAKELKKRKVSKLKFPLKVTDSSRKTTKITLEVKPKS